MIGLAGGEILDHAGEEVDAYLIALIELVGVRKVDDGQADVNAVSEEDTGEVLRNDRADARVNESNLRCLAAGAGAPSRVCR